MSKSAQDASRFGGGRAAVIGGSMAGLVAARVLADHFEEVIVVERDAIPDDMVVPRRGVPQGGHLHALLTKGDLVLRDLFPGIEAELKADGAVVADFGRDVAWHHFGGWKCRIESGVLMTCISRPRLEAHVRRRVFALPNVRRLDRREVMGLLASADRSRVTGVKVKERDGGGAVEELSADLVVEASGRFSKLPAWLEALGYPRVRETSVDVHVGYSSRFVRLHPSSSDDWKGLYILGSAPHRRLGLLFPMEGGTSIVILAGMLGEYPPDDPDGFMEFARSLTDDALYRALCSAEPLSEVRSYRFPSHLRRHYELMPRAPDGVIAIGDAVASFNPIYGQGMTTACLDALALDACLKEQRGARGAGDLAGFARRYHRAVAKVTEAPWLLATSEDFRYEEVKGERPPLYAALSWYTAAVHRAARVDAAVYQSFLQVMHMLKGPESLFAPTTVFRVLRAALTGGGASQLPSVERSAWT